MRKLGIVVAGLVLTAVSGVGVASLDRGATDDLADDSYRQATKILNDLFYDNTDAFTE